MLSGCDVRRCSAGLVVLAFLHPAPSAAEAPERWMPEHCLVHGRASAPGGEEPARDEAETRWNDAYLLGWQAIERGEYPVAEAEMCRALLAARGFGPRDWRFAETLDELGLIAFELRDYFVAERMQGAAIAEMLLAVGPDGEPLRDPVPSTTETIRPDCRSGVRVYTTRLGWINEREPGRTTVAELRRAPWRVFAAGYLPLDRTLARRLDWLVSQYLLRENTTAAAELKELQSEILGIPR